MYFQFACTHCGKSLRARDEHVGRRVLCPYCRSQVTVQRPEPAESAGPSPTDALKTLQTSAAARPARRGAAAGARRSASPAKWVDGTNVSMIWSGLFGLVATVVLYALLAPLYGTYLGNLFIKTDSGFWVTPAEVFLAGWAAGILLLKSRKLARQRQSMLFDLLPNQFGEEINEQNLNPFIAHINDLPGNTRESFLINRVKRGLEHFGVRKSVSEAATILSSQSDIDANAVESSYALLNVFIWAIPILGFIGTVLGIGAAVGGFSTTLESAADVSALRDSLKGVTGGLGTAFDTTFVALVLSMLIMFPTSSTKKAEEDLLNWVDEYCNENLLKRLNDSAGGTSGDGSARDVRQAINAAMADHHAELQTWSAKLETIGKSLARQVFDDLKETGQQEQALYSERLARMKEIGQTTQAMQEAAESLGSYCENLQAGLAALNGVLQRLGEQQVVVQQVPAPKRRGWLFGRRNGT